MGPGAGVGGGTGVAPAARGIAGAVGPEEELWRGNPSAKALLGAILSAGLVTLLVPLAVYFAYPFLLGLVAGFGPDVRRLLSRHEDLVRLVVLLLVAAVVGLKIVRLLWRIAVLKSHHYRLTNQRITVETGVLSRRIEEIDMRLVEDFQLRQSLLERLLRIGDITIISSDRTAGRLVLLGLPDPRDLRELIRTSAYQATRGQLFTRET